MVESPATPGSAQGVVEQAGDLDPTRADCSAVSAGATPLQRITRTHYTNSVRALLKLESVDATSLAEDEKVGVFDGNNISPVDDLIIEQYAMSAEAAARAARPGLEALVPCDRAAQGDQACAEAFIAGFGRRVYRRPLSVDERAAYLGLYGEYVAQGHADALRVLVQTMLQSPNFLYHVELLPVAGGQTELSALDPYELATRLSFFLTDSTPDDTLLDAAERGALDDEDGIVEAATRLLASDTSGGAIANFHLQWLALDQLDTVTKDSAYYPGFDASYLSAMRAETRRFVEHVLSEDDGRLATLFTAPYSFPSGPLLNVYGIDPADVPVGDGPIDLDPGERSGLLTQPAFLSVHAHATQSSPVARGKVVIRNLLCQTLPDPPPNVAVKAPDPAPDATTRERFAAHVSDASCAGCHARIDGIGFGFESFDAIGAFRSEESGMPVDATGSVLGTRDLDGAFSGVTEFAHKLVASAEFQDCVTTQWFRFALARMETSADACGLSDLQRTFRAGDQSIPELLRTIVTSPAFRSKRGSAVDGS